MLLVAVSGGIDSMCLAQKVRLDGGPFAIAHCNFGLRGAESDADEAFVTDWARKCGIPIHVKRFDTQAFASAKGISVEMAARELRYHWFGQLCRENGYEGVAVAHNANDNAETLLLNLLRGTGLRGLTGMKADGFIPDPEYADVPLHRPLLGMTREEIEAFAREQGLSWREDRTNAENDFKRNKLRNLVFPVFREINPRFVQTLNRDMERIAHELREGEVEASGTMATLGRVRGRGPQELELKDKLAWPSAQVPVGRTKGAKRPEVQEVSTSPSLSLEPWDGIQAVKQPQGMLILDADKAGELVEGKWESGDWIKPLGAPGRKKMQDWFTDHHIPAGEKGGIPLFKSASDPHHVLAVAGYCIDDSVKVTRATRRIFRISLKNA